MRSACEEQDETVDSSVLKVGVILFTALHCNSALATRISRDFVKDFVEVIDKVLISQRQWEPRQTASGGSSGARSSLRRTSVVWNHLIQNESHTVYASGGRG